jgi:hypothetical protein
MFFIFTENKKTVMIYTKIYKRKATLFHKKHGTTNYCVIYKNQVRLIVDKNFAYDDRVYLNSGKGKQYFKKDLYQFYIKIDDKFVVIKPSDRTLYTEINQMFEKVDSVSDLETPEYIEYYGHPVKKDREPVEYDIIKHKFSILSEMFENEKYDPSVDIFQNLKNKMEPFDGTNVQWGYNKGLDDIKKLLESVKI